MIGEESNRPLMYLIFTSRKRDNPLHVISLGRPGISKTHLQEKVASLIPEEDKLEITSLSGNAFYYFGQHQIRIKSGKKATGFQYEIISADEYEKLKANIASMLDEVLEECRRASAPNVSHKQNGSAKQKKSNKLSNASQRNQKGKQGDNHQQYKKLFTKRSGRIIRRSTAVPSVGVKINK